MAGALAVNMGIYLMPESIFRKYPAIMAQANTVFV